MESVSPLSAAIPQSKRSRAPLLNMFIVVLLRRANHWSWKANPERDRFVSAKEGKVLLKEGMASTETPRRWERKVSWVPAGKEARGKVVECNFNALFHGPRGNRRERKVSFNYPGQVQSLNQRLSQQSNYQPSIGS